MRTGDAVRRLLSPAPVATAFLLAVLLLPNLDLLTGCDNCIEWLGHAG